MKMFPAKSLRAGNNAKSINLPLLVRNTDRYYFFIIEYIDKQLNGADAFTSTKASVFLHNHSFNCRVKIFFFFHLLTKERLDPYFTQLCHAYNRKKRDNSCYNSGYPIPVQGTLEIAF